jgi:NADPH2:quinone reductase
MHAVQVSEIGGPEVLRYVEVPEPVAGEGQLVVAVEAAGLNYIDTYHRRGLYPVEPPFTLGMEHAGTVVAVGPGVTGFSEGDRVASHAAMGSYAEQVAVDAAGVVRVPDGVSSEDAAAVLLQGMTAHYLVNDTFPLEAGDRCLVHAGAGGVGLLLIQLAAAAGAEVFTTVSSAEKADLASGAGAHHVIRYDERPFDEAVRELTGEERPLDVVYDGVGAATFDRGLGLLRPRGLMALFGQASGPVPPVDLQTLNANGSLFVTRPTLFHYVAERDELEHRASDVFGAVADGSLSVRIGARYPLADAAEAHRDLEGRRTTGKVLLIP